MFFLGSAYPTGKLGINISVPPILFGCLRMAIVFICLFPFLEFKLPNKKYFLPLVGFSISMGTAVNLFLYLSLNSSNMIAPLVIGAQLSIPLAIIVSSIFIKESISKKKWIFIFTSFLGILLIGFDPNIAEEIYRIFTYLLHGFFLCNGTSAFKIP